MVYVLFLHPQVLSHSSSTYRVDTLFLISTPQVLSHSSSTYRVDALCPIYTPRFCPILHPPTELMLCVLFLHPQVLSHSSSTYRVDALCPISTPQGSVPFFIHLPSCCSVCYLYTPRFCPILHPPTELMVCVLFLLPQVLSHSSSRLPS